jgi:hypothetical protein
VFLIVLLPLFPNGFSVRILGFLALLALHDKDELAETEAATGAVAMHLRDLHRRSPAPSSNISDGSGDGSTPRLLLEAPSFAA